MSVEFSLKTDSLCLCCFLTRCLIKVRVQDGRGEAEVSQWTLGWGSRGGTQGAFPQPSWDGSEGGEEAVHMPTGVTYFTKEHFFFVKWTLTYLALGILGGGPGREAGEGWYGYGSRRGWGLVFQKVGLN